MRSQAVYFYFPKTGTFLIPIDKRIVWNNPVLSIREHPVWKRPRLQGLYDLRCRLGQNYHSVVYPFKIADPTFKTNYTFSVAFHHCSPLGATLNELLPELVDDEAQRMTCRHFYYSRHDASNLIDETNWPAYWCAIRSMFKDDYILCVNCYR